MPTTYDFIAQNKRHTWLLVLLFPLLFVALAYVTLLGVGCFSAETEPPLQLANQLSLQILPWVWVGAMVWIAVSYYAGGSMLLRAANAIPVTPTEQPEIYRLVENLCITSGLPVPEIYIMNDSALNAFATGRDPQHAAVALTRGIVERLDRAELEGVIAHELSHIQNRDIRLMVITVAGISFCTLLAELCFRAGLSASRRRSKNNGSGALLFFGLGLLFAIYGYCIAPLIRLAISRTREYQADASAALLTRNPAALARALEKISQAPDVQSLQEHASMAAMCIENPMKKMGLFSLLSGLMSTHPPVQKRIAALRAMDGR